MNVCRVAYLELRRINSIRNLLSIDAVRTQVCLLVLSRIDYCNSILIGLPQYLIKRLQGVQNAAARSILRTPRSEHSRTFTGYLSIEESCTRLLHYVILHYLALALNICLTLLIFTPLLDPCTHSQIPVSWALILKSYGQRYFAYHGLTTWNSLPLALRLQQESDCFKRALKTHLFSLD